MYPSIELVGFSAEQKSNVASKVCYINSATGLIWTMQREEHYWIQEVNRGKKKVNSSPGSTS